MPVSWVSWRHAHFDSQWCDGNDVSQTQDLLIQIKQITAEIHDIKRRNQSKKSYSSISSTNTHSRNGSDPLQECHEEHDKDGKHYEDSVETAHQLLDSNYNQVCCVPTQYPPEEGPTSSPLLPPEYHCSALSSGTPAKPPSKTSPWTTSPNDCAFAESKACISGVRVDSPSMMLTGTTSGKNNGDETGDKPGTADRKGVE